MIIISAQAFPPRTGGIQNLLAGTAEYIAHAGHEVLVLADGGRDARQWDRETELPYKIERFSGPRPWRRRRKYWRLQKLAKSGHVKAVFADTWKSIEVFNQPFDFPIVTWAHGNEFPRVMEKAGRIKKAMAKADHIIFNSNETLTRATPFTPDHVPTRIVNPPIFDPIEETSTQRQEAEKLWGDHKPRLLSMCRLIDWKGLDQAISAFPAVLKKFPTAHYVIVGIGDDRPRLEVLVEKLGLQNNITFLGWIEEGYKTALLKSADLFLQPGRQVMEEREGYGITYAEAALQGLPTVCGNAGGAPEAIIDGKTGLVVEATVTSNVEDAVLSILSDKKRHNEMRAASKTHGENCLWSNQVAHVLDAAGLEVQTN